MQIYKDKTSLAIIENKERYYYFDLMKSMAIFLVVIYHLGAFLDGKIVGENITFIDYLKYYLRTFMSMGVPIFFFVNGALLFNKKLDFKKHVLRIIKLIFFTMFWSIISFTMISIIKNENINIMQIIKSAIILKQKYNNHIWFLYTLVILYIFFPLLKIAWDNNKKVFYFFLIAIFIATVGNKILVQLYNIVAIVFNKETKSINTNIIGLFNPVAGIYGYSLVYFMLGAMSFKVKEKIQNKKYTILAFITLIASSILLCLYWILIGKYTNKTPDYVFSSYDIIFTVINTICIFIICTRYKGNNIVNKTIKTIGSNTLGIYLIHMFIIMFLYNIGISLNKNATIEVMWAIIITILSLIITVIIKKIPIIKKIMTI